MAEEVILQFMHFAFCFDFEINKYHRFLSFWQNELETKRIDELRQRFFHENGKSFPGCMFWVISQLCFCMQVRRILWKINVETVLTRLASAYVKFYVVEAFCFRKECR